MSRNAFSLIEMLVALAVAVAATTAVIAYVRAPRDRIAARACELRQAELQLRVEEYFRSRGQWPSSNLRELSSTTYTIPNCPITGEAFRFNASTQQIDSHGHIAP